MNAIQRPFTSRVSTSTKSRASDATRYTMDAAAGRLSISQPGVRKLIKSGTLPSLDHAAVDALASRPDLVVDAGELAVLRTSEPTPNNDPGRSQKGFHMTMNDAQIADGSLRYWFCDAERIIRAGGLFIITISTIPVAVYDINGYTDHDGRKELHGDLLGRYHLHGVGLRSDLSADERAMVEQILAARVRTNSGGPMAYLPENAI